MVDLSETGAAAPAMTVPQAIRELRLSIGESQQRFATKLDLGIVTIVRWEAGQNVPEPKRLEKLAELARSNAREDLALVFTRAKAEQGGIVVDLHSVYSYILKAHTAIAQVQPTSTEQVKLLKAACSDLVQARLMLTRYTY